MFKKKFNFGDIVRINRTSNIFEKLNFLWFTELFKMSKILDTKPLKILNVDDTARVTRFSVFFYYELQKVKNNEMYQIEKILKSCTCRGKGQLLVRWLGYDSEFDSWIAPEDLNNV